MRVQLLVLLSVVVLSTISTAQPREFPKGGKIFYDWCLDDDNSASNVMTILWGNISDDGERNDIDPQNMSEENCHRASQILAAEKSIDVDTRGYYNLAFSLDPIGDLIELTSLGMDAAQLHDQHFKVIGNLASLERLSIYFAWAMKDFNFLRGTPKMKHIFIAGIQTPLDISVLKELKDLEHVELNAHLILNPEEWEAIKQLPQMKKIIVNHQVLFEKP